MGREAIPQKVSSNLSMSSAKKIPETAFMASDFLFPILQNDVKEILEMGKLGREAVNLMQFLSCFHSSTFFPKRFLNYYQPLDYVDVNDVLEVLSNRGLIIQNKSEAAFTVNEISKGYNVMAWFGRVSDITTIAKLDLLDTCIKCAMDIIRNELLTNKKLENQIRIIGNDPIHERDGFIFHILGLWQHVYTFLKPEFIQIRKCLSEKVDIPVHLQILFSGDISPFFTENQIDGSNVYGICNVMNLRFQIAQKILDLLIMRPDNIQSDILDHVHGIIYFIYGPNKKLTQEFGLACPTSSQKENLDPQSIDSNAKFMILDKNRKVSYISTLHSKSEVKITHKNSTIRKVEKRKLFSSPVNKRGIKRTKINFVTQ